MTPLKVEDRLSVQGRLESSDQLKFEQLRSAIPEGIAASERNEVFTEEKVLAELENLHNDIKKAGKR